MFCCRAGGGGVSDITAESNAGSSTQYLSMGDLSESCREISLLVAIWHLVIRVTLYFCNQRRSKGPRWPQATSNMGPFERVQVRGTVGLGANCSKSNCPPYLHMCMCKGFTHTVFYWLDGKLYCFYLVRITFWHRSESCNILSVWLISVYVDSKHWFYVLGNIFMYEETLACCNAVSKR